MLFADGDGSWTDTNVSEPGYANQPGVIAIPGDTIDSFVFVDSQTGVITIKGNDQPNTAYVRQQGTGQIEVEIAGAGKRIFDSSWITQIIFDGGAGGDRFENNTDIPVTAYGGSGNDTLQGGAGDDDLHGNEGNDFLDGGNGDDDLNGGIGNDTLEGGAHDDYLFGHDGIDHLKGEGGNDTLRGGAGGDDLDGGADIDTVDYSHESDGVHVDLRDREGWVGNVKDYVTRIENIIGTSKGDDLRGDDLPNVIKGGGGKDDIYGRDGNDQLEGGTGNDHIRGQTGADILLGGDDNDILEGGDGSDLLDGGPGTNDNRSDAYDSVVMSPEAIQHAEASAAHEWKYAWGQTIDPVDWTILGIAAGASIWTANPAIIYGVLETKLINQFNSIISQIGMSQEDYTNIFREILTAQGSEITVNGYQFKAGFKTESKEFFSATRDGLLEEAENLTIDYIIGVAGDYVVEADIPIVSDTVDFFRTEFGMTDVNIHKPYIAWRKTGSSNLTSSNESIEASPKSQSLSRWEVRTALHSASAYWRDEGAGLSRLNSLKVQIADLPGTTLGNAEGTPITIDQDAAGHGWFVDHSPADDADLPGNRMDLLTAVTHEVGHVLGHNHNHEDDEMDEVLDLGERHIPTAWACDFATSRLS